MSSVEEGGILCSTNVSSASEMLLRASPVLSFLLSNISSCHLMNHSKGEDSGLVGSRSHCPKYVEIALFLKARSTSERWSVKIKFSDIYMGNGAFHIVLLEIQNFCKKNKLSEDFALNTFCLFFSPI